MGPESAGPAASRDFELARLAAIVESSDDAIIGKTLDGTITSWNAGAEQMYGYASAEMLGRNVSELIPPDRPSELVPLLDRLGRGGRVGPFETKRVRKDGSIIDVSVCISPIRDAGGTVIGASTVARDMTERNLAEAERQAMARELHQSERLEILGQLAGGIAHDFNNMLAAILSYAGFVAEETADRPTVQADAEQIQAAALRAARLTRQLLIFSSREVSQPEALDLNAIITGIHELLSASIGSHIDLRVDLTADLGAIMADRSQVEQILLNLVINARDAMQEGGTLTIRTSLLEPGAVPVPRPGDGRGRPRPGDGSGLPQPGGSTGQYVELAVSHTGTGISADVAPRIFEPFFTTKPLGQGTGLGLSTVHTIVEQAGGSVSIDSEEGAGTTFFVRFPASGLPVRSASATAGPGAQGHGETILVVDDEAAVLEVTSRILRRNGYATLEATTGQKALSLASSRDFQLLLTDSIMPGVSGPKLAEQVTALKPGVRVLHMSGDTAGLLDPQGIVGGRLAFVQKPFTAQALLEKVRDVLTTPPGE
ncbi:MAG: PAS domain S-box protein [Streptosporangiaceae bacterium]